MGGLVEAVVPARMGTPFRWLVGSAWASYLADGIAFAAGPLLVASRTHDPLLVALAGLLERLPWLLFGLYAGALADRLDRRRLVVLVDLLRAAVLGLLILTIVTGWVSVGVVLGATFALGTADVFSDCAYGPLLPMLVDKADLGVGNARMSAGQLTGGQLVGPAVGAALFAAGSAWPFATQAVLVTLSVLLVARIRPATLQGPAPSVRGVGGRVVLPLRREVLDGLRWTWRNAAVRTLTLTIVTFNVTFGAAWSVLVLYAQLRLHLAAAGYGLLTTAGAVGGIAGTLAYDALERRFSLAGIMRVGLIIETLTHLGLALASTAWVAMVIMFVFGGHAIIWGTTSRTIRMRAVPLELQGRVGSLYAIGVFGGIVVGQALGGVIARTWGVTGPFWFAFGGSALMLALIWRQLRHISRAEAA